MKQMIKLGLILALYTSIACVSLALVSNLTSGAIRIAGDKAKFGQPEAKLGIVPGFGGMITFGLFGSSSTSRPPAASIAASSSAVDGFIVGPPSSTSTSSSR